VSISPDLALAAARRASPQDPALPRILIAGATGLMGHAMVRRLVGMHRARHTQVLATMPMHPGIRHVSAHVVPPARHGEDDFAAWPILPAEIAVVMFDRPRLFYGREKALWTPIPHQLPALGAWIEACGVHTLAIVLPVAQGSLPESLKHGLANLDEHALASLRVDRLLLVRTAQKPGPAAQRRHLHKVASWMLGITGTMVPQTGQPVRAAKVAEFVDLALRELPGGNHVFAPEVVWQAAQGDSAHMRRLLKHQATGRLGSGISDISHGV